MVLLTEDELDNVYKQIKHDALAGVCTVLVLVSNDVDALCASKILLEFFKADCIGHHVFPVGGYDDLLYANQEFIKDNHDLRTVVLLNCGGTSDLTEVLSISTSLTVYVVDSHRPYNLDSMFGSDQIIVLGSSVLEESQQVPPQVRDAYSYLSRLDKDSEDFEHGGKENSPAPLSEDIGSEQSDGDELATGSKRSLMHEEDAYYGAQRKRMREDEVRRSRKQSRRIIAEYYSSGSYFGQSVSCTVFQMSVALGHVTVDTVWFGIVGLTHSYLAGRISNASYAKYFTLFHDQSDRLTGPAGTSYQLSSFSDDFSPKSQPHETTAISNADTAIVSQQNELKLMLYRHWSLWEALFFSPYVATKLGIWREKGRQKLSNFLAAIGFPQTEYTQPYSDMSLGFRRTLAAQLQVKGPQYGLRNMTFKSFYRQYGYRCRLSASDVAYSLSALLDGGLNWLNCVGTKEAQSNLVNGGIGTTSGGATGKRQLGNESTVIEGVMGSLLHSNEQSVATGMKTGVSAVNSRVDENYTSWQQQLSAQNKVVASASETVQLDQAANMEESSKLRRHASVSRRGNFYVSFDSLKDVGLLQQGIHLAMHFQSEVVHTGISILDNRMIKTLKSFRLVVLGGRGGSNSGSYSKKSGTLVRDEFKLFGTSVVHLERLAQFLLDAVKEYGKASMPLVIAALHESEERYLVMGLSAGAGVSSKPNHAETEAPKNIFGLAFQATAQDTNVDCKMDNFDSSVVELGKDDLSNFMIKLQSTISEFS